MYAFKINGGHVLKGTVQVKGAKNAILPLMAAALLTDEPVTLHNISYLSDVVTLAELLKNMGATITTDVIQHERIHTRQMLEMLVVGFYIWYVVEWLIRIPMKGRAYSNISMEREAYDNMHDPNYLLKRKPYAWTKYLTR